MLGAMLMENPPPFGDLLRSWRQRRRLSQLDLALEAEISARHLSFVETGRARPSREMVLRLAEHLDLPLRARNALLTAAIVGEEQVEASAGDLLSLEGMDAETARTLASKGIHTTEDLAELAVDELTEMSAMDAERAKQLIMAARAPWFAQG